jgi:hypothetical protein
MSVTGPATSLQAILTQIQAPARPAAAPRAAAAAPAAPTARPAAAPVAQAQQAGGVSQNGAAQLNPNAPRGTYLNIVV